MNTFAPNDPDGGAAPVPAAGGARRKSRWRRRLLIVGICMLLVVGCVAALPTVVSITVLEERVRQSLEDNLGTEVSLDECSFGWLSGVHLAGLVIQQPPGFPGDRPAISLQRADLRIGLLQALGLKFDLSGELVGLEVVVHQLADGTVNLTKLGGSAAKDSGSGGARGEVEASGDAKDLLQRLRAHLAVRDVRIDLLHETRGRLESIQELRADLDKPTFAGTDFDLHLSAKLAGADDAAEPGRIVASATVDGTLERPLQAELTAKAVDFARYRPLVDAFLEPGALTALDGILDGNLDARVQAPRSGPAARPAVVDVDGTLTVTGPHLAGNLLQGMNLQAAKWTVTPKLRIAQAEGDGPPAVDASSFSADFGLATLTGVPSARAAEILGGKAALALDFRVDLQGVGKLGGPVPAILAAQPADIRGTVALAVPAAAAELDDVLKLVTDSLHLEATLALPAMSLGSATELAGISLRTTLIGGKAAVLLADGASLNGGGLRLQASADLAATNQPARLGFGVDGARLAGESVELLQYVVPLFAGLAGQPSVQLDGSGSLRLELSGSAAKSTSETWLQWLGNWSGGGHLGLGQGRVRPAPELAGLLQWADPEGSGALRYDGLDTDFSISRGSIETKLLRLQQKAGNLGLVGRTTFTGDLDHRLDLTQLLQGHKDGAKVLKYLGEAKVEAQLAGTLAAPRLGLPDLGELLAKAAQNAAKDEVQKAADKLLQKGLDQLFRRK